MKPKATLFDIADALGISIGTVHRALHNHHGVSAETKARVLEVAQKLGYRPNLAARYLSSRRKLRISVNTLKGTTSFWDEVRAGIEEEAKSLGMESVEIEFRTYPGLDEGEEEAFAQAVQAGVDGIITYPSRPEKLKAWMRKAASSRIPVVCVATDAPETGRLAVVSVDTLVSGSLAADLMGRFLKGQGKVLVTLSDMAILEHAEKFHAFQNTLHDYYPGIQLLDPIQDHDVESEAYAKCLSLFRATPELSGVYVTTEASLPVLNAARDAGVLGNLIVITTDLFPALVPEIHSGAVAATIYQRPRTQGLTAFRVLYEYLSEGKSSSSQLTLAPHLVMRGNLEFFLQRESLELREQKAHRPVAAEAV
jgi:LacI family transcriptional regulator